MKKTLCLALIAVLGAGSMAWAQIVPGKRFELSTSASLFNVKYKGANDSTTVINVPLRVGVYIFKGLAFEPELTLTFSSSGGGESNTAVLGSGNLSYSFILKGKVVPFILAGAGYGNGQELLGFASDLETGILALHAGAGVKVLINETAAIRLEYRFTNYSGEKEYTYSFTGWSYSYTEDYGRNDHKVMVGISIFL